MFPTLNNHYLCHPTNNEKKNGMSANRQVYRSTFSTCIVLYCIVYTAQLRPFFFLLLRNSINDFTLKHKKKVAQFCIFYAFQLNTFSFSPGLCPSPSIYLSIDFPLFFLSLSLFYSTRISIR